MVDTITSGRVVARLIIVAPIMNLGMPVTSATQTAPSTNQSPPLTMSTTPTANSRYISRFSMMFLLFLECTSSGTIRKCGFRNF